MIQYSCHVCSKLCPSDDTTWAQCPECTQVTCRDDAVALNNQKIMEFTFLEGGTFLEDRQRPRTIIDEDRWFRKAVCSTCAVLRGLTA